MSGELTEDDKRTLRDALVRDRSAKISELAVRARSVFTLDEQGTVYLEVPKSRLNDALYIATLLVARKMSNLTGISAVDTMSPTELSKLTGLEAKRIRARVSEMRQKGWVEHDTGGDYRVVLGSIREILDEVGRKTGSAKDG